MNLYLISQDENGNDDACLSAVVSAPDEETARNIDPREDGETMDWSEPEDSSGWVYGPEGVMVTLIGKANPDTVQGVSVICRQFNNF